jgi:hypothetical protein
MSLINKHIPSVHTTAPPLSPLIVHAQGPSNALAPKGSACNQLPGCDMTVPTHGSQVLMRSPTSTRGGWGMCRAAFRCTLGLRWARRVWTEFALAVLVVAAAGALASSAAPAANFTWSGGAASGEGKWSNTSNWLGGAAPSGTVETLTFPLLTSGACTTTPETEACRHSENDLTGVTANALDINLAASGGRIYFLAGKAITLGSGGLTATMPGGSEGQACLELPIVLGAAQTWSVDGAEHFGTLDVTNVTGSSSALNVALSHRGQLNTACFPGADIEVGSVSVAGADPSHTGSAAYQNGNIGLFGSLNATDGHSVSLTDVALFTDGSDGPPTSTVGALSLKGASLSIGSTNVTPTGILAVAGDLSLDSSSQMYLNINGVGTTAGADYSQVKATGNATLGGAQFQLQASHENHCPALKVNDVYTLVAAEGTINGTFAGISGGTTISLICNGTPPTARIDYSAHAVTATIESEGSPTPPVLPPVPLSSPVISGTPQQGQTLTESPATWENEPTAFSYQWERCDAFQIECQPIAGATGRSYTLLAADVGSTIRIAETASNRGGSSGPAISEATPVVQAPPQTHQRLTVTLGGTGSGTVVGAGISCPGSCSGSYSAGAQVTLTATAASGSVFDGWSGGGCSGTGACQVTLNADTGVTATFSAVTKKTSPQPILGQQQLVSVVSGTVTVRLKGTHTFVALLGVAAIPDGSEVEATNGRVLITAATPKGTRVTAEVYGGRFRIHQDATGETHFILTLPLTGCPRVALPHGSAAAFTSRAKHRSGPRARHLWVSETGGKWGTNGRYVSTSVEGTTWLTLDECTRSDVKVTAGKVNVRDLIRKKAKKLGAGKSYIAVAVSRRKG